MFVFCFLIYFVAFLIRMFQESSCTLKYVDSIVKTREEHKVNKGLRNGRSILYDMTSGGVRLN